MLYGYKATCYPAFKDQLAEYQEQPVVIDRHIVTSQGPATAAEFSFAIIKLLVDDTAASGWLVVDFINIDVMNQGG